MKRYFLLAAIAFFVIAFFNSCYYDKEDLVYATRPNQQNGTCDTTNVTYSAIIKPIFDNYCNGCHSSGTLVITTYGSLSSYLASNSPKFLDNINYTSAQPMPPSGKLNDCSLKQIRIWIQAGYPNN
ncbi:MAG: hypothetical protein WCL06_00230 [Bacteroidota bacterium]